MKQSNSKLADYQKEELKNASRLYPDIELYSYPVQGVTIAIRQTSETMAEFAVSIMSADENKFRAKVGKYYVLERMLNVGSQPCRIAAECDYGFSTSRLERTANNIANSIS